MECGADVRGVRRKRQRGNDDVRAVRARWVRDVVLFAIGPAVVGRGRVRRDRLEECVDEEFARLFRKPQEATPGTTWEDVAHELEALGKSLGDAVRAVWQHQENRERVRGLQRSLQAMVDDVNRAIEESVTTPEAQQAREQLSRVTESVRVAVETSTKDLGPDVLSVLRQMDADLRRMAHPGE